MLGVMKKAIRLFFIFLRILLVDSVFCRIFAIRSAGFAIFAIRPLGRICNPTASNISICNAIQNRLWQH